ncbi:hypothetical protein [Reinekea blandensis]|uniref:Outer membrane protein assembly factor BamC n=1 Tax=Reinekea blandensis MED297 TaxID=314283 RepID=A4BHX6_9GAMM|nr:hypothetical protein [Reinekea blandensis]EAR08248.1 hypothetical protein MED297_13897 [Reinekea sp. MED297] [Reinekea blandensis MED297]
MSNRRFLTAITVSALWLAGCASDPVYVSYTHPENSDRDWYPIPADAPSQVEVSDPEVPRVTLSEPLDTDTQTEAGALSVVRRSDSLGNETLLMNRRPGTAWEVMNTALTALDLTVSDRNREEYRFEITLGEDRTGLFSFFQQAERLNIVLIPQGVETIVAIEGENDEVPESDAASDIIDRLLKHFQTTG